MIDEPLRIGEFTFTSRLFAGTGRHRNDEELVASLEASGAEIVTVAIRRLDLDNPNAPAQVKQITAKELKKRIDAGDAVELFDVRSGEERNIAKIDASRILDDAGVKHLEALSKDALLVFHCHLGGRSQSAAEHFLAQGFTNVHNLVGGIAAWSADVDSSVATY